LGVVFGVAAVVGGMIGQGILRTPGIIAGAAHSPGLIMILWLFGACLVAVSAFAYVELGTAIPCAGGPYDFVRRAFGDLAGVIAGWAGWLICISAQAFMSTVVAEFVHRLGLWPDVATPVLAVCVLAFFWAVNWAGTRISADSQILFSAAKGLGLIALVLILFLLPASPAAAAPPQPMSGAVGIAGLAIAMRAVINTYAGWEDTVYHCEELKNPERTLPRSMATGIISVTALYLIVNLALLHVLSPAEMASSKLPAADAARSVLGHAGDVALTCFGILSVAAITNLYVMRSARVSFAMARQGHLPARLSCVAPSGTPRAALAASVLFAALFASTGTYETIVATNVALNVSLLVAVNLAVMALRHYEPDLPRPFRMPLYPIPAIWAVGINVTMLAALIFEDPVHSLAGLAILALVGVVYWVIGLTHQHHIFAGRLSSLPKH
jgi:APA family basic amino acid/polyamine antiporter